MDVATQTHLTALRALLAYRLRELSAAPAAPTEADGDVDDLDAVTAALRRLDEGGYGDCAGCGAPIAWPRLLVQPATRWCAACAARRAVV